MRPVPGRQKLLAAALSSHHHHPTGVIGTTMFMTRGSGRTKSLALLADSTAYKKTDSIIRGELWSAINMGRVKDGCHGQQDRLN